MKHILLIACVAASVQALSAQNAPTGGEDTRTFTGKVLETTNTAGYTYVLVQEGTNKLWAAANQFPVQVGDAVTVNGAMAMRNYHSRTLNRDFDVVYFTSSITPAGAAAAAASAPALPAGHPPLPQEGAKLPDGHPPLPAQVQKPAPPNLDVSNIQRAPGGKTVQEIVDSAKKLSGKTVAVRGRVFKYNSMILGKNWLHIRDGSGSVDKNNHDITVTTTNEARIGDIVLVTGVVATDKDFGAGYRYSVLVEEASLKVE